MGRLKIIVLAGLPASGKSTWVDEQGLPSLSSDATRALLTGDETNQSINRQVFATMRKLLRLRLKVGAPVTVIDATALSVWERRCWIRIAELNDCEVECVFFDVSLEECLRRNAERARRVPVDALKRMAERLTRPEEKRGLTA